MNKPHSIMAPQIARVISIFHKRQTGHAPRSVTVVLSGQTLVITLHKAPSPAEVVLAQTAAGAAQMREYHRRLFERSPELLRQEIRRIIGVAVHDAAVEVETTAGAIMHAFTSGTMLQVFRLAGNITDEDSSGTGADYLP